MARPIAGHKFRLPLESVEERKRPLRSNRRYYGERRQLQAFREVIKAPDAAVEEFKRHGDADSEHQAQDETGHHPQVAIRAGRYSWRPRRLDHAQVVLPLGEFEIGVVALFQEISVKRLGHIDILLEHPIL